MGPNSPLGPPTPRFACGPYQPAPVRRRELQLLGWLTMWARCSASPSALMCGSESWGYLLLPCARANRMVGTVRGMRGPADRLGSEFINGEVDF
jgi:hypothetical protein